MIAPLKTFLIGIVLPGYINSMLKVQHTDQAPAYSIHLFMTLCVTLQQMAALDVFALTVSENTLDRHYSVFYLGQTNAVILVTIMYSLITTVCTFIIS